jgi:ABC-type phosphate/phosphonate transport system ATPase subunit
LSSKIDRSEEQIVAGMRQAEEAIQSATLEEATAKTFVVFASRAGLSSDLKLLEIALAIEKAATDLSESSRSLKIVEDDLKQLEEQGLRWTEVETTRIELVKRRFPLRDWSQESVEALSATIASFVQDQINILQACVGNADEHRQQIAAVLGEKIETIEQARVSLANLEQRSATATSLATRLADLDETFPIPKTKPLGEVAVEAEAVRQIAIGLQTAIQQERENNVIRTEATAKRTKLTQELGNIRPPIKNLSTCVNVLQRLQREHSLHAAMEDAIRQNRAAIESIFGQIHAPHEFSGLGKEITTLRRLDGTTANLSEISTGQRSALGLSMFLAQNMKLVVAPPVILIDDPVAHVDDLNCLSFLDYLREIALTKRRQIFFSTANDKLAAMFERKFDFLGAAEFKKFVLYRESTPSYLA